MYFCARALVFSFLVSFKVLFIGYFGLGFEPISINGFYKRLSFDFLRLVLSSNRLILVFWI